MTDTLLTIIAVLLAVRIVLQLRQGKRAFEKCYTATSEVEHTFRHVQSDTFAIRTTLNSMASANWEFVGLSSGEDDTLLLFFTRKKFKNYYED